MSNIRVDDRRGCRGPSPRDNSTQNGPGFQGPDAPETHSVRLHNPDVMRRIASQAYFLWMKRGRPRGNQLPDWIAAEEAALGMPS